MDSSSSYPETLLPLVPTRGEREKKKKSRALLTALYMLMRDGCLSFAHLVLSLAPLGFFLFLSLGALSFLARVRVFPLSFFLLYFIHTLALYQIFFYIRRGIKD